MSSTVVTCYDVLSVVTADRMFDFTEGKYFDRHELSRERYFQAQEAQAQYLLDQVGCDQGSCLLDIGCGYGRVLWAAKERGCNERGITISPHQVDYCVSHGLDVELYDYRHLPPYWNESFTCLIANGSLEHFVEASDVHEGRADYIYQSMFNICRKLIHAGDRFATTAIHFREKDQIHPYQLCAGSQAYRKNSPQHHFRRILLHAFGGWYPYPGQLERCAKGFFRLVHEEEGTADYHTTSEYWLMRIKRALYTNPRVWRALIGKVMRHPDATYQILQSLLIDQSWMWQFRGKNPPTRLYRHTWEAM